MMDIGTHVKVQRIAHIGRRSQSFYYKQGKIVKYYPYGNYYLVDLGKYKECYKPSELLEVKEDNGNLFQNRKKHNKDE